MSKYNNPPDGTNLVPLVDEVPVYLQPGQLCMYKFSSSVGVLYKGNPDCSVSPVDTGSDYTLPVASDTVLGGVKIGNTLEIVDGVLDVKQT